MDAQQKLDNHQGPQQTKCEVSGNAEVPDVRSTRPDIIYTISALSQFSNCPKQMHMTAIKRVYRYLKGTKNCSLVYKRSSTNLYLSTDASWDSTQDARSFSGYVLRLGSNTVAWRSIKQKLVLSTCEAEIIAKMQTLKWVYSLLESMGMRVHDDEDTILETDSQAEIDWVRRDKVTNRSKHINRKYYFIKQETTDNSIIMKHVRSEDLISDLLTKPLIKEKTIKHSKAPGLYYTCEPTDTHEEGI